MRVVALGTRKHVLVHELVDGTALHCGGDFVEIRKMRRNRWDRLSWKGASFQDRFVFVAGNYRCSKKQPEEAELVT